MTMGEGRRKVYMLLDEYSAGGVVTEDDDIKLKIADFFDIAQKDMANYKKIIRETELTITGAGDLLDLPERCEKVFRVWRDGELTRRYFQRAGKIGFPAFDDGVVTVEYFAVPQTIGPDTPDAYEFEVSEDAAVCLPFFVAAQNLMPDLVVDYSAFLQTYLNLRNALDVTLPEGAGAGGVRQKLWR